MEPRPTLEPEARLAPTANDLLAIENLELELAAGDPAAAFTAVRYAGVPADAPWLGSGDLRLTNAPFTPPRPARDPVLTPRPGIIVYGRTPRERERPMWLVERAVESGVTLLLAPPAVPLKRVAAAGLKLLTHHAAGAAHLLSSPQGHLLSALNSPKPERELLERVGQLTGLDLVLLTPWGDVLATAGSSGFRPPPNSPLTNWPEGEAKLGGERALILRVESDGRLRNVLVAFGATPSTLPWLELSRTLLLSSALSRSAEERRDSSALAALLAEWLAGPQAAVALESRLAAAGISGESPYLVAVAEVGPRLPAGKVAEARRFHQLEQVREAGEEYFRSLGYGVLSETREERSVWVFTSAAPKQHASQLLRALKAAAGQAPVRLGLSLPRSDLTGVGDAHHQALLALESMTASEGLTWFDELDPIYWVLKHQPQGNLEALRDRLIGTVKEADRQGRLWRTLKAYVRSPGDMQALAAELHIHVNTLRYRLRRIEEIVREPLSSPETLAKLYLALQIDAMLERGV